MSCVSVSGFAIPFFMFCVSVLSFVIPFCSYRPLYNPVEFEQQKELIMDEVLQTQRIQWPERGTKASNEFKIEVLATDGKGDPTNLAKKRNVALGEKVKHLIRFGERINDKWEYRFASHPRFAYWAFNMLQRHRRLAQGSVYLKKNPAKANAYLNIDV